MAPSLPRAKQSRRFGPHDTQVGLAVENTPPRFSQPFHFCPSNHLCHMASSMPRAIQSMRFGPHDTQEGLDESAPRRFSQPFHCPSHQAWYMARSVPRTKQSKRFALHEMQDGVSPATVEDDGGAATPWGGICGD